MLLDQVDKNLEIKVTIQWQAFNEIYGVWLAALYFNTEKKGREVCIIGYGNTIRGAVMNVFEKWKDGTRE